MAQQSALKVNKANSLLGGIRRSVTSRSGADPSPVLSPGETSLECWVQSWAHQYKRQDRLEQCNKEPWGWWMARNISHITRGWKTQHCLDWKRPMEDVTHIYRYLLWWVKKTDCTQWYQMTEAMDTNWSKHKENLFLCEDGQTLEKVALRGCVISNLGDIKKPNCTQPQATCSKWPCSDYGLGLTTSSSASSPTGVVSQQLEQWQGSLSISLS